MSEARMAQQVGRIDTRPVKPSIVMVLDSIPETDNTTRDAVERLGALRKTAEQLKSGWILNSASVSPDHAARLPESVRLTIERGGDVIIDHTGGLNIRPKRQSSTR